MPAPNPTTNPAPLQPGPTMIGAGSSLAHAAYMHTRIAGKYVAISHDASWIFVDGQRLQKHLLAHSCPFCGAEIGHHRGAYECECDGYESLRDAVFTAHSAMPTDDRPLLPTRTQLGLLRG